MLFKQKHKELILNGTKTATRRIWKKPMVKVGGIYKCKTKMLSKEYFAKIEVIKLYLQKLGKVMTEDAKKEGYKSIVDFYRVFEEINGMINMNQIVYVIEFKLWRKNK